MRKQQETRSSWINSAFQGRGQWLPCVEWKWQPTHTRGRFIGLESYKSTAD